jgi:hypothetical protein
MVTPHRMPLVTLGWQSWSVVVVVLMLTMALAMLTYIAVA